MKRKNRLIALLLGCMLGAAAIAGASAEKPETVEGPAERSVSDVTAYLDVRKEAEGERYELLVNGEPLEWEQSIEDAVRFCRENGLAIDSFSDGNGISGKQKMMFCGDIPLVDESSFYLDQGGGPAEGKLNTVRMFTDEALDTVDEAAEKAQWLYEKLRDYLGKEPDSLLVYTGGDEAVMLPFSEKDMTDAVKRMLTDREGDFSFVSAHFDNLSISVPCWDTDLCVKMSLTIF